MIEIIMDSWTFEVSDSSEPCRKISIAKRVYGPMKVPWALLGPYGFYVTMGPGPQSFMEPSWRNTEFLPNVRFLNILTTSRLAYS